MEQGIFKTFCETMASIYLKYYNDNGKEKCLDFCLKNSVSMYVLLNLYNIFVSEGLETIDKIDAGKKQKYWELSFNYFSDKEERIQASKAIYVMEMVTGNF